MGTKLVNLPRKIRRRFEGRLRKSGVVAEYLYNLRPADVSIRHRFELQKDEPVYSMGRRQSPKHNRIIREELQKMMKAGVIVSASSE